MLAFGLDREEMPEPVSGMKHLLKRARCARVTLHALWLRGLRTGAPWRYFIGVIAALVPFVLRIALNPYWGEKFPYVFYFPATMFTALFAGLGPAWVGIGICAVGSAVWILPWTGSLWNVALFDLLGLAVFVVSDGIIAWVGASHRDVIEASERQATALAAREVALARAVTEGEAANRAKDNFLAILSHELRNPLTTILSGVRVLRRIGNLNEKGSSIRDAIERQGEHLSRLVDDLLDMKRIVGGDFSLELRPCNLAAAIERLIDTLKKAGTFKDHTMSFDAQPVWVKGDADRLQQITANLIGNAVKYTPAGGSIRVSVWRTQTEALLRVQDTGIGISPDLQARIFELFVQGEPGPGQIRSGLGIGLALVRRLVELHAGVIEVWSDGDGKGSSFTVRLPRVSARSNVRGRQPNAGAGT
jgi:signal transduction histidine kinase